MSEVLSVTNGRFKLIVNDRLLLVENAPIEVTLKLDSSHIVILSFAFEEKEKENGRLNWKSEDIPNGIKTAITLVNFNNSLGTGLIDPISIMKHTINGQTKNIVLMCYAFKLEGTHYILDYSLYEEI